MSSAKVNLEELKSGGFIAQRQKDLFTVRMRCPGGRVPLDKMRKILEVAEKYGNGYLHMSFRQSVEIPYVNIADFDGLVAELEVVGQKVASCGPRVRVPTACAGCEYNPNGLTDTQAMAQQVDQRFFAIPCPHKFKVSFSGCPIDCARSRENDLGFQGVVDPEWHEETCKGCRLCIKACREGALVDRGDGRPQYYPDLCTFCGDCIKACPTDSWQARKLGWVVRIGGKHGRHPKEATEVAYFASDQQLMQIIERTIAWYQQHGQRRERIGDTLDRVGLASYMNQVFADELAEVAAR